MKTLTNEKTLEQLIEIGLASYKELKEANCIQHLFNKGIDDWGQKQMVIIDTEGNQWDYQPEEFYFILRDVPEAMYLDAL